MVLRYLSFAVDFKECYIEDLYRVSPSPHLVSPLDRREYWLPREA